MHDFRLNGAVVRPRLNEIEIDGRSERLSAKFIDVLLVLAEHRGEVIGKPELLKRVWNDPLVGDESLAHAIWILRKTLGDDAKRPAFIETIPRRGYRLIAEVGPVLTEPMLAPAVDVDDTLPLPRDRRDALRPADAALAALAAEPPPHLRKRRRWPWAVAAALVLGLGAALLAALQAPPPASARVFAFRTGGTASSIALAETEAALVVEGATLYAVDLERGSERWRLTSGGRAVNPALQAERVAYFGADDGYVYALDMVDGHEHWRYAPGRHVQTVPAIAGDRIVIGDVGGDVHAVGRDDGVLRWRNSLGARTIGPLLGFADVAVVRTIDGTITALDLDDGRLRWQQKYPGPLNDLVALGAHHLAVTSDRGYIAALDVRTGKPHWQVDLPAATRPLVQGGRVFALGRFGDVLAVQASDGEVLWRAHVDIGDVRPLVGWGNQLVVALDGGALGLLDSSDGRLLRSIELPDAPAALGADAERLLVTTLSGTVYRLDRQALGALHGRVVTLDADGMLHARNGRTADAPRYAIERLHADAELPTLAWRRRVVGEVHGLHVSSYGTVYLGDEQSVVALSQHAAALWHRPLSTAKASAPVVVDGRMFIGRRDDHRVYAFDSTAGDELWSRDTGGAVIAPPTVDGDRVYVGSESGVLQALRVDNGEPLWSFKTGRNVRGAAAVAGNLVIFGSGDRNVYALERATGAVRWRFLADDWVVAQPVIHAGRVFIGAGNGDFHALELATGRELWRFHARGKIWDHPAIDDERVYFASGDRHVYALSQSDGSEQWRYRTGAAAEGGVVLDGDTLYAGSHDFHLYALDRRTGRALWRLKTGGPVLNPALSGDLLVVASTDQHLYGLRLSGAAEPTGAQSASNARAQR